MRWTFLIALALAAVAAAANPAIGVTGAEAAHSYGMTADRPGTKELIARLDRLCDSRRKADQRRCEES